VPKVTSAKAKGKQPRRARGSLSREQIVQGAFDLSTRTSIDQLTMPALAKHMGVGVTSIYWYFRTKDELLDALVLEAFQIFYRVLPWAEETDDWRSSLRRYFTAFRRILLDEPVIADLIVNRVRPDQSADWEATSNLIAKRMNHEIGNLVAAGFSSRAAWAAYAMLSTYTRGCVRNERLTSERLLLIPEDSVLQRLGWPRDISAYKYLLKVRAIASPSMASDEDFQFGLDIAIAGLVMELERHPVK
jgi:AcrR family transcriptional regulator